MLATVPSQVTVYDLHRATHQRTQRVQHEANEIILDRCYARIKRMNKMRQTSCMFVVPRMLFGRPLFDADVCSAFIMRNLTGNGFYVTCPPHNATMLYISWDLRRPPRTTTPTPAAAKPAPVSPVASAPATAPAPAAPRACFGRFPGNYSNPSPPPPPRVAPAPAPPPVPPRGMRVVRQPPVPPDQPRPQEDEEEEEEKEENGANEFSFPRPFASSPPSKAIVAPSLPFPSVNQAPSSSIPEAGAMTMRSRGGGGGRTTGTAPKVGGTAVAPCPVRSPSLFERSIRQFKPSGKFSLAL